MHLTGVAPLEAPLAPSKAHELTQLAGEGAALQSLILQSCGVKQGREDVEECGSSRGTCFRWGQEASYHCEALQAELVLQGQRP